MGQGRAGAGPWTVSFRPVRLWKMPQTSSSVQGKDGQVVFMGGCPWEASCYLAEGLAGMMRKSVPHQQDAGSQRSLGLHVRCKECAGEALSAKQEKRSTMP